MTPNFEFCFKIKRYAILDCQTAVQKAGGFLVSWIEPQATTYHSLPAVHVCKLVGDALCDGESCTADSDANLNQNVLVAVQIELKATNVPSLTFVVI